jgi:hypothetical protein
MFWLTDVRCAYPPLLCRMTADDMKTARTCMIHHAKVDLLSNHVVLANSKGVKLLSVTSRLCCG